MKLELLQSFAERIMAEKTIWYFGDVCPKLVWGIAVGHLLVHATEIFPF